MPGTPARVASIESLDTSGDKVAVYCRVRPPNSDNDLSSARLEGDNVVVLTPPETSRAYRGGGKETHYTFTKAFGENSTQKDVFENVGLPLVKDLLTGWNSLLFMYGVTGSGKTHSMQGTPEDGGIMARAVDVLFNSITDNLVSMKRIVIPDGTNGFSVQEVAKAMEDRQRELVSERQKPRQRINVSNENLANRVQDESMVEEIDRSGVYAVFVSYVEVYNEKIYDLLERDPRSIGKTKSLMGDNYGWQYVHGCVEVEVDSAKEALETFYRGQKRRREAATALNAVSSRSHSIFNIRLVKAKPNGYGEVDQEAPIVISQLSLVDMAGSERTNRTGNTGEKLIEASSINNSLTTLRRCIKQLRDNQKRGRNDHIPYRDSQITKMFGSFFDCKPGCGTLRMMVCINPRPADFDENLNVMEFAETAQKIQIERIDPIPRDLYATPGRLRGQEAYREALKRAAEVGNNPNKSLYNPIYSLGPEWPSLELQQYDDEETLDTLERFLGKRISTRHSLIEDHAQQVDKFRARLVEAEKEIIILREENHRLKYGSDDEKRRVKDLETRLVNAEAANNSLQRKNAALHEAKSVLEKELDDKELEINVKRKQQERSARKLKTQLSQQEALNSELAQRLKDEEDAKMKNLYDKAKLRAVRKLVSSDDSSRGVMNKTVSDPDMSSIDRENGYKLRRPLASARSNNDVSSTPVPTPRRVRSKKIIFIYR